MVCKRCGTGSEVLGIEFKGSTAAYRSQKLSVTAGRSVPRRLAVEGTLRTAESLPISNDIVETLAVKLQKITVMRRRKYYNDHENITCKTLPF